MTFYYRLLLPLLHQLLLGFHDCYYMLLQHSSEDFSGDEEMLLHVKEMTKWSSNDLMDKMETTEMDEGQGRTTHTHTSLRHMYM